MEENKIKELLKAMNFLPKNGVNNIYTKDYPFHNNYCIEVDFNNQKICYGNKITVGNTTTSNFSKPENFVVLECVNRLLEKGYKPQNIELEKIYPSGHGHSGNLDILVYSTDKKAYLMIECKTMGTEFNKEHNKMIKDGGQLFTYYALDRDAHYLCLYSSIVNNGKIEYKNDIVYVDEEWKTLSTSKEIHIHWNKSFKDNGIFEKHANPYNVKHKALTYEMLIDLQESDSGKIFNQIMEILRHNVVSDKPNAFNKLLNLFVCKIIDENKNDKDELQFQWLENDTDESLQMRLNDLYKAGMKRFLNINVTDYSEDEVNDALQGFQVDDNSKQAIINMFKDTRLKKSPNFAFKEVLDEKSFRANSKIVKEIVELLQGYKFRYKQKHQFLGDFFELLLNTSMKQEAGQYFTPVPITRFIISSLPIKEFVNNKIKNNESDILPTVIDYATGSGHFLTEYMEQVQNIVEKLDIESATPLVKNKVKTWVDSEKFSWANEYVYGIDLDDRLVKTAKVSAFFNGDGEANIIWANGLDSFESDEYVGKLKYSQRFDKKNNGQFDILISNPPYSVDAFKTTLKDGANSFELYDYLTDNSSEIECLFVERMKQLLKVGGWAGIILPISIFSNSGIYSKTREILFKNFKVKSIVELGSGTFMKTGTNTVILFLERRKDNDYKEIELAIEKFLNDYLDVTVFGIENAFSTYVSYVYDNLSFEDYINILRGNKVDNELYIDYNKDFNGNIDKIKQVEKEKLLYFILTYNQEVVVIKTGEKQEAKKFLGYEFSERRGHEGLKWLPSGTKLYNDDNLLDNTKANSYVYNAFKGIKNDIDDELTKNIFYERLSNLLVYGTSKFDKQVNLNNINQPKKKYLYPTQYLEKIANIEYGERIVKNINEAQVYPVYGGGGETFRTSKFNRENRYIISRFGMSPNCVRYVSGKFFLNDSGMTVSSKDDKIIYDKFIDLLLFNQQSTIYKLGRGPSQKNIDIEAFKRLKIPIPPLDIQKKIILEFEKIENESNRLNNNIIINKDIQDEIISKYFEEKYMKRIGDCATLIQRGKSAKYGNSTIQIIKSGQARGYTTFDFTDKYFVSNSFVSDERNLIKGDLLINSTGVGTAGRVTLFDMEGNYVVDSHITIVRLNHNLLLPKFALYSLCHIGFKNIENMATGQSGQIELSPDTISQIKIPILPISEQIRIVDQIERYEKDTANIQNKLKKLYSEKKSILNKYL